MKFRVFDIYGFNIIDKVIFKETKPYLEQMLAGVGYSYKNLGFSLEGFIFDYDKVLTKYPSLQKYFFYDDSKGVTQPYISSISENWREGIIHADREDWDDIAAVFSKIPRPFSIPFATLIYDGINWFEDSDDSIAINYYRPQGRFPTPDAFYSNRIKQVREFDYGRKYNRVSVCIEVTAEHEPRDSKEIIKKLIPYLGEPTYSSRECIFPQEELLRLQSLQRVHREQLKVIAADVLSDLQEFAHVYTNTIEPPIKHLADIPTLNKAFLGTGFKRQVGRTPNWLTLYSCTDEHGFIYAAHVQKLMDRRSFRFDIEVSGYNFSTGFFSDDYTVTQEGESLGILQKFAKLCVKIRDEYAAELAKDFGDSPLWYCENTPAE